MTPKGILLALPFVFSAMTVSATVRYVDVNSTNATPPYTNWATAASVIQDAVDAGLPGDEILVTNGIYGEGGAVVVGNPITNRMAVTKPITVQSVNGPETTFIRGYQAPGTTNGDTAVRCVYLTNGATLAGFTLTGGATRDTIGGGEELSGGGVFCASPTAVVSNCVLVGNSAGDSGGGAYSGTLFNCMLASNSCRWHGGGAIFSTLNNCNLTGNSAILTGGGGAGRECTLNNCLVIGNTGDFGGGTVYSTLTNCTLTGNSSRAGGGTYGGILTDCTLKNNSASLYGGGAYGATLNNCTLISNSTSGYGGGAELATLNNCMLASNSAIAGGGGTDDTFNNCTITGNSANDGGGSYDCLLNNCIVYYNFGLTNANYSASVLNYCCTLPLPTDGTNNITLEPQLIDLAHIRPSSPCRGVGSAAYVSGTDIDGEPWANPPSIGCDEVYNTPTNVPPTISPIGDQVTLEATPTPPIPFTVSDAETPVANLIASGESSNTALLPLARIAFGGAGANRTVTLTPAANQSGQTTVTVKVTDTAGLSASNSFILTVTHSNRPPSVTLISPIDGTTFTALANIVLTAKASDTDGTVAKVEFFANETNKLGEAATSPYTLVWSNSQAGNYECTAVAIDNQGSGWTSAPVKISVVAPIYVTLVSPANFAAVCPGTNINLTAVISNAIFPAKVDFYAGSTFLGSATTSPYNFTWSTPAWGDYSLSAKLTDAQGNSAASGSVLVTVIDQCGEVAIIGASDDPEIAALQQYLLYDIKRGSHVFDQQEVTAQALQTFKLIIWDNPGLGSTELAPGAVDALQAAYTNGIPLYFIGERVSSAAAGLPEPQSSEWRNLTHLSAPTGLGGDGILHTQSGLGFNPIFNGLFGAVGDFDYPPRLDIATNMDTSTEVLGTSGGIDALLVYPGFQVADSGQTRVSTQLLRVSPPDVPSSTNVLRSLFENTVYWLLRAQFCIDADLSLQASVSIDPAQVGQLLKYDLRVVRSGECDATGVIVTNPLPPGVQFVTAQSEQGTWAYDPAARRVTFFLGLVPVSSSPSLSVTVVPVSAWSITNLAGVSINGQDVNPSNNVVTVVTQVQTNAVDISAHLSIGLITSDSYALGLIGVANVQYQVQASTDLRTWITLTNLLGPDWTLALRPTGNLNDPSLFYRARLAP